MLQRTTWVSPARQIVDVVVCSKAKSPRPLVVSEVLHGKTGVADIDGLDHKYFVDGWLAPIPMAGHDSGAIALEEGSTRSTR